jgi:hypothetical protein
MSRGILTLVTLVSAIFLSRLSLFAISLEFVPPTQNVSLGNTAEVALKITGLGNLNPAILNFNSITFGDPVLGDQLDLLGLGSLASATSGSGLVNVFELSFDSVDDLNNLQAADFILARLFFDAIAGGISPLTLNINALGDALGDPLTANGQDASVSVTAVREPSSISLLLIGSLLFVWRATFRGHRRNYSLSV